MTSYRIECPEIDSALACETFPTRGQAECVAEWVHDMECFSGYSIVEVEGPPTTHADEWLQCSGHPGYPGPCPDGMDWGDWLAENNLD
jgi:hypothetical protein